MKEMILVHSINQCQFHAHCIGLQVHNNSENSLQAEPCIRPTDRVYFTNCTSSDLWNFGKQSKQNRRCKLQPTHSVVTRL